MARKKERRRARKQVQHQIRGGGEKEKQESESKRGIREERGEVATYVSACKSEKQAESFFLGGGGEGEKTMMQTREERAEGGVDG